MCSSNTDQNSLFTIRTFSPLGVNWSNLIAKGLSHTCLFLSSTLIDPSHKSLVFLQCVILPFFVAKIQLQKKRNLSPWINVNKEFVGGRTSVDPQDLKVLYSYYFFSKVDSVSLVVLISWCTFSSNFVAMSSFCFQQVHFFLGHQATLSSLCVFHWKLLQIEASLE